MRALMIAGGAVLIGACSIGALDGFSGDPAPADGGTVTDAAAPGDSSVTNDATPNVDGAPPTTSAYHAAVAADAPLAHFALEETSGAACASSKATSAVCLYPPDQISHGHPGVGGTKALRFETTTATLTITGGPSDLALPYSFELWIRVDAPAPDMDLGVYMNPGSGNGDGFNLFLWDDARVRTELWKDGALIAYGLAPSGFAAAVWHHLVIAHTPNPHVDLFYVDGQIVEHSTNNPNSARPVVTSALTLFGFVGFVDEIALYDKALPADRIAAHYAAQ